MGLDNFAVYPYGHPKHDPNPDVSKSMEPSLFEGINLCGGLFTDGGSSFRGKVYAGLVEDVSGYSLFDDLITNEGVGEICRAFEDFTVQDFDNWNNQGYNTYDLSWKDVLQLRSYFFIVYENGGAIESWW
jgi:hypothetical protein